MSLRNQTHTPLEVIVVDDGSTSQESTEFLDKLESTDEYFYSKQWKVLRQANAHVGAARNAGADIAAGEFLLFMDDDNYAKPHEVSTFVQAAIASVWRCAYSKARLSSSTSTSHHKNRVLCRNEKWAF